MKYHRQNKSKHSTHTCLLLNPANSSELWDRMSKKTESKKKKKYKLEEDTLDVLVQWGENSNNILFIWLDSVS